MKESKKGILILFILTLLSIILLYLDPSITGFTIYEYQENTKNWDLNNLNYNSDEIEYSNNQLKLKLQIQDNSYTETIENTATVTSATKNREDQTNKVTEIDNKKVTINKNNVFDIVFDQELNNDAIINLNLDGNKEVIVSLCNQENPTECYSSLNYPGSEGDYTITIENLENLTSSFKLNVDNNIRFNYISATYYTEVFYNVTILSYPKTASATTEDLEISNLDYYGTLTKDETLNEQTIDYFYSTNSGNNWNQITDFNLSSITEKPIKFKVTLNSNKENTPILNSLSLNYFTKSCIEDWICTNWFPETCPSTEIQTKTCTDNNTCGTENHKPEISRICEYTCEENWECAHWSSCSPDGSQSITCTDLNNCTGNKIEIQNCTYINYSTRYEITQSKIVNIKQDTVTEVLTDKTKLEILLNNNVTNNNISIIDYNSSNKTLSEKVSAKRFVDITASDGIRNTLKNYILKLYYTNENVQGLNEDSLNIYYYNGTLEAWQELESYVNKDEKYVWANLTHFSTYGIFGDEQSQPITPTSSSGSSGGGGSSSSTVKESVLITKSEEDEEEIIENEEEPIEEYFEEETIISKEEQEPQERSFKNFITGQTTLIKNKITEFAEENIYLIILILSVAGIYLIYRSITFFKVKNKKKLIIFDFDGVIADTFDETYKGFGFLAKKYNFKPLKNKDELRDLYKQNIFKSLKKLKIKYSLIPKIKKDAEERANQRIVYVKTFPGIKSLIKNLKGYNLAIISSNEKSVIEKFLIKNNINKFNLILDYRTHSKKRKLKKAIKHFKLTTKEALFITDTVGDVNEAKKLKLETIAVTWGFNKKEDFKQLKVRIVEKPEEILRNI